MSPKIFVANIAAADDGDLSVGDKGLVVHPLVDASEVGDHAKHPQRTHAYGVEHPHLDIGMTVDGEQDGVGGHRAEIVEQQAHAHAPVGRAEQTVEKNLARQVLVPNEILHIETALRRIRQGQPRGQGVAPVRELVEAGLARMRGRRAPAPPQPARCRRCLSWPWKVRVRRPWEDRHMPPMTHHYQGARALNPALVTRKHR